MKIKTTEEIVEELKKFHFPEESGFWDARWVDLQDLVARLEKIKCYGIGDEGGRK